jgi:glucose/arabinose dehydrogenase
MNARRIAVAAVVTVAMVGAAPQAPARTEAVTATAVVTGLEFPAAFTFLPDGRILYAERFNGELRIYDPGTSSDTLFYDIPSVLTEKEQGLLGVAVHPGYPTEPYVYAYVTQAVGVKLKKKNRIVRLTDAGGTGTDFTVLHETKAAGVHNGGVIHFGPDGKLWAVIGELSKPANAQNLAVRMGKVIRLNPDGSVPADNPFPGSAVWSYGHRNMFGFAFDPVTGDPWVTENGPKCNDEVNRVEAGQNYGWGKEQDCALSPAPQNTNRSGPSPVLPLVWITPTVAPTGAAFCDGCGLGADTEGTFLFGTWKPDQIRRLTLNPGRDGVASSAVLYQHSNGVLAVEAASDGTMYFSDPSGIWALDAT